MTTLPPLKYREAARGLEALGFRKVRQKGGHAIFHHEDCRRAPIPVHPAKTISRYLMADIVKQLGIPDEEFLRALGRER